MTYVFSADMLDVSRRVRFERITYRDVWRMRVAVALTGHFVTKKEEEKSFVTTKGSGGVDDTRAERQDFRLLSSVEDLSNTE